ncbi:MAG: serine/threonine protein kinase [Planctomycetota bacterium JB042]
MRPVDDRTDQGPEEFDQALDQARAGDLRALLRLVASGDAEADQRQLESLRELIAPPVPDIVLQRGTRLGSFTIREPIGAGGMGCVYLADQEAPRREVALKVLRRGSLSNRALGRFEREQEALGRLNHPGIARIYDAGTSKRENDTDLPYFAMERVQGVDLLRHAREQDLTLRQRVQLLVRVVDAVRCAHESLVIHRDLKPDNILVTEEGQPKVLDFGVARLVDEDHVPSAARTVTGSPIGTWAYMSPEQGRGDSEGTSPASDVFSLGVIAWELLSGRSLWPPAWTELPPALGSVDRRLDGDVSAIIEKALEVDPRRRYQNARDLADDLNRYLAGRAVVARDIGMMGRAARIARRRPVATTAAIAITTMAITVLVFWTRLGNAASRERQLVLEEYGRRRDSAQSFISFLTKARLSELGPGATAGEFLRLGLLPIVERFADTPELYAQLLEETARTTVDLEEFALLEELAERLVAVRSRLDGARSSSVAAAMQFSVTALGRQGRHEEAVTAARHSLQLLEADPHSPAEILDAARNNLAVAADEIGNKQ